MGLLDKAKNAAEQAAARAKEGVEDVQTKRDLSQTYLELGKVTYRLVESGDLSNPELTTLVEKIQTLETRASADPTASTTTEPPPSDQPPAMPT